jgi:hypothetical protein
MRALLIGLAALLLAACASTKQELVSAPSAPKTVIAVGTLSTNACEAAVAPTYTQAITVVEIAEARVRAGRISLTAAQQIADLGRAVRADLDAACPNKNLDTGRLTRAQATVDRMRSLLGG